jgi:hypothetical protein
METQGARGYFQCEALSSVIFEILIERFAQRDSQPLLVGLRLIQSVLDCIVYGKASRSIDSGCIVADPSIDM